MTVYSELVEIKEEAEHIVSDYARQIHNAPFVDFGGIGDTKSRIRGYEEMIKIFSRRAAALYAAIAALPVEVAESEV